jgi:hypothetical protein
MKSPGEPPRTLEQEPLNEIHDGSEFNHFSHATSECKPPGSANCLTSCIRDLTALQQMQ